MKSSDFICIAIVLGFLLMYFLSSKLGEHSETLFACLIICVMGAIHRNLGPKM